jgi:predicted O-methyltransferase YrrM
MLHRPFQPTPEPVDVSPSVRLFRHPVFAWLRLRPVIAQHTRAEGEALRRWARGTRTLIEIGVAEGASALTLREAMPAEATLYLIDPFHLGRVPLVHSMRHAARSCVSRCTNGKIVWIERFSFDAVATWTKPIDFLFLDGDHVESAVQQDWSDWHSFVVPSGVVAFHDARVFPGGWTGPSDGPVKVVNDLFRRGGVGNWEIVDEVHSLVVVRRTR